MLYLDCYYLAINQTTSPSHMTLMYTLILHHETNIHNNIIL